MYDTGVVGLDEASGYLGRYIERLGHVKWAFRDALLERGTRIVGHCDEHLAINRRINLVNGADVRVI
jgi:hypothetical protein